jgi:hypothetical protein
MTEHPAGDDKAAGVEPLVTEGKESVVYDDKRSGDGSQDLEIEELRHISPKDWRSFDQRGFRDERDCG